MRIESALNTGREGITAHGQAIAVVGDNISNANTVGYKGQKAIFADILGEIPMERNAEVLTGAGDGVAIREIQTNYEVGPVQATGRDLDVALSGNGFFVVGDVAQPQYTRNGSFVIDENGFLTTTFGQPVLGYAGNEAAVIGPLNMNEVQLDIVPTTEVQLFGNLSSRAPTSEPPANPLTYKELNAAAAYTTLASVYDSLGDRHEILFAYFRTGINTWSVQAYANGGDVGQIADQPVQIGQTAITFDSSGRIPVEQAAQAVLNVNANWGNGAAPSAIAVSLGAFTQFAGATTVNNLSQNGQGAGDIVGYEINGQGGIYARLTNGGKALVGSLALASVRNEDGLARTSSSTYTATEKAGDIQYGLAGTGGRSRLLSQTLEYSNVDLAGQFIELVVLQRAYAANSKVISTANEVIKDTISLIR